MSSKWMLLKTRIVIVGSNKWDMSMVVLQFFKITSILEFYSLFCLIIAILCSVSVVFALHKVNNSWDIIIDYWLLITRHHSRSWLQIDIRYAYKVSKRSMLERCAQLFPICFAQSFQQHYYNNKYEVGSFNMNMNIWLMSWPNYRVYNAQTSKTMQNLIFMLN